MRSGAALARDSLAVCQRTVRVSWRSASWSAQCVALARDAVRLTGLRRLALAGGVVSNVKATRLVRLLPELEDLYVFPHMGDGGLALGAAVLAALGTGEPVCGDLSRLDLGPEYAPPEIEGALTGSRLAAERPDDLPQRVADLLAAGRVVMWFQGRMEYGPRALGQRSVLARPDRPELRDRLNLVLKRRVWYQPFCPSMLESEAPRLLADWTGARNRAMTMAFEVGRDHRASLAGVISVDGTCRPQFVPDDGNERVRGAPAPGTPVVGRRRRAEHELQHPRRTAGLFSGRSGRRVPSFRSRRACDRSLPRAPTGPGGILSPRRQWLVLVGGWVAALAAVTLWLSATRNDVLREQLKSLQFWSLEICLLAGVIAGTAVVKDLARGFRRIDLALMVAPAALGLALTLLVAERTNRIYYDEQIYQSAGHNLADLRRAQICNDGTVEYGRLQCGYGEYNKQPYAYPHLLSLAYRVAGVGPSAAFVVNALVMALTVARRLRAGCASIQGSRAGLLRRAAGRPHPRTDHLVGDGRRRAVGGARDGRGSPLRRMGAPVRDDGLARRRGGRACLCGPVPPRVGSRRRGLCGSALAARPSGVDAPAVLVGRAVVFCAGGRPPRAPVRRPRRRVGNERRAILAAVRCRKSSCERTGSFSATNGFRCCSLAWHSSASSGAVS